jgi:hypothetical protein
VCGSARTSNVFYDPPAHRTASLITSRLTNSYVSLAACYILDLQYLDSLKRNSVDEPIKVELLKKFFAYNEIAAVFKRANAFPYVQTENSVPQSHKIIILRFYFWSLHLASSLTFWALLCAPLDTSVLYIYIVKCIFIPYYSSPTCFRPTHDHHQSVLQDANKTHNKKLICVGKSTWCNG